MNEQRSPVEIKGYREGLRIIIDPEPPFAEVRELLFKQLDRFGEAFAGTGIFLDVGERTLGDDDLRQLRKQLERRYGLELRRVLSSSDRTRESAEILNLRGIQTLQRAEVETELTLHVEYDYARVVRQTILAGQVERFYEGSILVLGDVNPGGEVTASGDIIVLGALRGVAWAGCLGDTSAVIVAHQLAPTQLRISAAFARPPAEGFRRRKKVEIARIEKDQIIVEDYEGI